MLESIRGFGGGIHGKGNALSAMIGGQRSGVGGAEQGDALERILLEHVGRHPELRPQDLYKLIYQAAMGCEHAVRDVAAARSWLEDEVRGLREGPQEPVVDRIAPEGRIVRINLRPYLAGQGDLDRLFEAFIQTSATFVGSLDVLRLYLSHAEELAAAGKLPFSSDDLKSFLAKQEAEGFPAVHHSDTYRQCYRPAYRVVCHDFLPGSD